MPPAKRQEREDNEERLFSGGKTANFEATEFELVLPAGGVEEPTSLSAAVRGARCMVFVVFLLAVPLLPDTSRARSGARYW